MNRAPDSRHFASDELDRRFMQRALTLAYKQLGLTSPNPSVGCVIVRDGRIVGRGATQEGGRPHAETVALADAGTRARNATAYVTFEPCAHTGKTPPCARALVAAKISRVVVGCLDPYPPVRGRGIGILRSAGIQVKTGVMEKECRQVNQGFISRVTRQRPLVTLKLAMTLDGKIATASGDSRWISSQKSRALVHQWRKQSDVIMVGAGTVIADDPQLTCRIAGGRDPVRAIIDARLRTSPSAKVFTERSEAHAILVTTVANAAQARRRYTKGRVEILALRARGDEIDLLSLMKDFGRRGWNNVLLEGGARLAGSALRSGVVDRVAFFIAPRILGAGLPAVEGIENRLVKDSLRLADLSVRLLDEDVLIEGRILRRQPG